MDNYIEFLENVIVFPTLVARLDNARLKWMTLICKTALVTHTGLYWYISMHFGLKESSEASQWKIAANIRAMQWQYSVIYIENAIKIFNLLLNPKRLRQNILKLCGKLRMALLSNACHFLVGAFVSLRICNTPGNCKRLISLSTSSKGSDGRWIRMI